MTILERMRIDPWSAIPSNEPVCRSRDFEWDGGYFVCCRQCGRIGPVPILLHVPHTPPAKRPTSTPSILDSVLKLVAKLLPL